MFDGAEHSVNVRFAPTEAERRCGSCDATEQSKVSVGGKIPFYSNIIIYDFSVMLNTFNE